MKRDGLYSWLVAFSCSMVVFCSLGMFRTSGVFYLEIQDMFSVSREAAVWPIGIAGFTLSLCASMPGFLIHFITLRLILFIGITLITSGLGLCFFVTSTTTFTIFYGIIFAVGAGLCVPTSSILMNGHFVKYRGIANSILFSGDSLALFLMTPLTSYLLRIYDLRGACLIIAGIFCNLYVLLMILKPFRGTIRERQNGTTSSQKKLIQPHKVENDDKSANPHSTLLLQKKSQLRLTKQTLREKLKAVLLNYWNVFKDPMYQICTTTQAFYSVVVVIYCIVIADYALDRGLEKHYAILLITVTGGSELMGRACIGFVVDHHFLEPKTVSALSQISVSILLLVQTFVQNNPVFHFALSSVFGFLSGSVYCLGNVIYVQYLGIEKLGIALSLKSFLIAILAFLRPVLIGLSRDYYGTYVYLFYILAALALIFGLSWVFEPIIMRNRLLNQRKTLIGGSVHV